MTKQTLPAKLARAVQDEVAKRDGSTPPSYLTCLNKVHAELKRWEAVPMGQRADTWQAIVVQNVTKTITPERRK